MAKKRAPPNLPETKFGPYAGGISIAVWTNTTDTALGTRQTRSVTISPRQYRDSQTGDWKDSYSYRPNDLPVILCHRALQNQPLMGASKPASPMM